MFMDLRFETDRLVIREIVERDCVAANRLDSDPRVVRYMSYDVLGEEGSREYILRSIAAASATPRTAFDLALTLRGDDTYVGRVGFAIRRPEHHEAELWFQLRPDLWGRGLVVEALWPVIGFAFHKLEMHRIFADCDPRNAASGAVLRKLGMRFEGHLRENYFLKGEWCDSHIYGLLAHEWNAQLRS